MATEEWTEVPLNSAVFTNLHEQALRSPSPAMENSFMNELGGHTRFPGMSLFKQLPVSGRVYLHDWRGDLIAVTSTSKVFRIDADANETDVTGVGPKGGKRATFAQTENQLLIAMGGPILQLQGPTTTLLSDDAPEATHVVYMDGRALANEKGSQRFQHTAPGVYTSWNPLDIFSAEGRPDDIEALITNEFREMFAAGPQSIEQWEPFPGGPQPFFRRWSVGEGIAAPYTLVAADNGVWAINSFRNFVRFQGQTSKPEDLEIAATIQASTSLDDAWAALMVLFGQHFIILSLPKAVSPYGLEGITALLDYRQRRWSFLYGWDDTHNRPTAWPGCSYHSIWGRHFVGGKNGEIFEMTRYDHNYNGGIQRMLWRSGHFDGFGKSRIDRLRLRLRRGEGSNTSESFIRLRSIKDNNKATSWQTKSLGLAGDRDMNIYFGGQGTAETWQFEYYVTDDVPIDLSKMDVIISGVN